MIWFKMHAIQCLTGFMGTERFILIINNRTPAQRYTEQKNVRAGPARSTGRSYAPTEASQLGPNLSTPNSAENALLEAVVP